MSTDNPYSDGDVYESLAERGWEVDAEDDGRDFERYHEDAQSEGLWFPKADRRLTMPTRGAYPGGWPAGAIVHFTAGRCTRGDADAEATIRYGAGKSHCYFCISTTGRVYQTAPLNRWGSHAGQSQYPGLGTSVSSKLVGIEVCNAGRVKKTERGYEPWWNKPNAAANTYFQDADVRTVARGDNILAGGPFHKYTPEQEASLIELLLWLQSRKPAVFRFDYVLGHDEVSPGRKDDPGGSLSMVMPSLRRTLRERLAAADTPVAAAPSLATTGAAMAAAGGGGSPVEPHAAVASASAPASDFEALRRLAALEAITDDEAEQARGSRDYEETEPGFYESPRRTHPVPVLTDDEVRALVSKEARIKIVEFEVSSEARYRQVYQRPILPGVASGITVGIGYDLGHNTPQQVRKDFDGLIPPADIELLTTVCGLKGSAARPHLDGLKRRISIPWEAANEVFGRATVPRFGRMVLNAFPNAVELKGHCFGMLLSLVYNRGDKLDGDRRREMRAIRDLMAERRWREIPEQFRLMKRLWKDDPNARGLLKRRDAEALMFERGLELMQPAPLAGLESAAFNERAAADPTVLEGDGYYYRELDETGGDLERSNAAWDKVVWSADAQSPDYSHIPDRKLSGTAFQFGVQDLELLLEANAFQPSREHGRIVFALRGAQLVGDLERAQPMSPQENRETLILRETRPDHRSFRCVIGVYDVERGRLSGYSASTVPNPKAVASYVGGGSPSNMMLTGCYEFQVGWHQESQGDKKIPGCLIEYGRRKAVLRTKSNYTYDMSDVVHDTTPGDNVHPGKSEGPFPFSSWGCLVLKGSVDPVRNGERANVRHTGEWAQFRRALGLPERGTGGHGRKLDVVLLTGLEAAIAARARTDGLNPNGEVFRSQLHRLRQGSRGHRVARLCAGLGLPSGEVFTSVVAAKLADLQRAKTGGVHGLYAPQMDSALGLDVFATETPVAMLEGLQTMQRDAERDRLAFELGAEFEASRGGRPMFEDTYQEGLLAAVGEFGTRTLVATGKSLMRDVELALKGHVCDRDGMRGLIDRDSIQSRIDNAAKTSMSSLKHVLVTVLRQATFAFVSYDLMERVVGFIMDQLVLPLAGQPGRAVIGHIDGGIAWLCAQWTVRLAKTVPGYAPAAPAPKTQPPPPAEGPSQAEPASQAMSDEREPSGEATRVLGLLQVAASGESPDVAGVRNYIRQLRDHLRTSGESLSPEQGRQFLDILCDSRFMAHISGTAARDPYAIMADIEDALNSPELDRGTVEGRVRQLCEVLGDARVKLQPERIEATIKALRRRRMPEQVSLLADRVLTREPDAALLGRIGPYYALSLIDSQRIVAGIEVLHATLERAQLSAAAAAEVWGGMGRAHKQIYVNHVRSASDAVALQQSMGQQLARAIDAYGKLYDAARPGENAWHGVNLIALLKRAKADRVVIGARHDPDRLAEALIGAVEAQHESTTDHFRLATLGEAYLAIGNIDRAAQCYAAFAQQDGIGAFELNSAIRQLEEVWQLEAGNAGAGALLLGLKATLTQKEGGRITLSAQERRAIAAADSAQYQSHFETTTRGGRFVPLEYLKRIVFTGMAVAAIKQRPDRATSMPAAGDTVGTGFLIDGSALGLESGRSYVLTNAHVLWDPHRGQGIENMALKPDAAEIVFEGADGPPSVFTCSEVLWQSPSGEHDACLFALDRIVPEIKALDVAARDTKLESDDGSGKKGTPLVIVGHPKGGALSIAITGSLEEISARLVDKGPRANSSAPVFLHYSVPTEPGNSGSPVLETEDWRVVGLHHAGFDRTQGRAKLGGKAGRHHANEGICIQSIRDASGARHESSAKSKRRGWFG